MAPTAAAPAALPVPLPDELPPPRFEKPAFDPFVGVVPAALKPLPVDAPLPVATVLPPPPPPAAPALNYRYLGQMVSPAGVKTVYLARADVMVPVSTGTLLEEGYVVEAIDGEGVRLHYPPMKLHALIALPPPENPSR